MEGRDIEKIIITVIEIVPKTEIQILEDLNKFKNDLVFRPPELRKSSYCWTPFINLLNNNIPEIKEDWQIKIRDVVNIIS
jgi:hypothetical protein